MAKRKRESIEPDRASKRHVLALQVVTGSYEGVLHGFYARVQIPERPFDSTEPTVETTFTDNFLVSAHTSAIRCLAVSPPAGDRAHSSSKRVLATGGSDEGINLYQLSTVAKHTQNPQGKLKSLSASATTSSRELGTLLHHASTITSLNFPSRSKLISSCLDNTIAITRTKDWTMLSNIKAPIPKPMGRPSGDTAGPGEVPAGMNAVAVHPSTKLCISVSIGERCMRLWNLVTGKKAGVLTFDKETLAAIGEAKWRGGEGRKVVWSWDGAEFAIAFERAVVVYSIACKIKFIAQVKGTKVCQIRYLPNHQAQLESQNGEEKQNSLNKNLLLVSTDDGRVLLFDTDAEHDREELKASKPVNEPKNTATPHNHIAQIGVKKGGSRVKDFDVVPLFESNSFDAETDTENDTTPKSNRILGYIVLTGSSDGLVQVWHLDPQELPYDGDTGHDKIKRLKEQASSDAISTGLSARQIGRLLGQTATGKRITCIGAFSMDKALAGEDADGAEDDDKWAGLEEDDTDEEDDFLSDSD